MNPETKIMTLAQAAAWAVSVRKSGRKIAVTNGVFDLLHRGHTEYLLRAAAEADVLLVAVNSDASVRSLKGPSRPIIPEADRAWMLASLECVSAVVIFNDTRATEVFQNVPVDVYVKGGDYSEESLDRVEYAALKQQNVRFCFIPLIPGRSTSSTVKQIRGEGAADFSGAKKTAALLARRSVRKFQLRPVGEEMLKELLEAAMAAPSAGHKDPWHFYVIRDEKLKDQIADCLPNGPFLKEAPACVLVCGDQPKAHAGELSYLLQDCSAAQENLLLAASMTGLGACWLGIHPRQERIAAITRLLDLPEGRVPVGAAAIGWPADFPAARTRYEESKVTWK